VLWVLVAWCSYVYWVVSIMNWRVESGNGSRRRHIVFKRLLVSNFRLNVYQIKRLAHP